MPAGTIRDGEREAEAEETGRPPETKLTKGRGKKKTKKMPSQVSGITRVKKVCMGGGGGGGGRGRRSGQLGRGVERLEKTEGFPNGVSSLSLSLSLSCSPSPYFPPFFSQ